MKLRFCGAGSENMLHASHTHMLCAHVVHITLRNSAARYAKALHMEQSMCCHGQSMPAERASEIAPYCSASHAFRTQPPSTTLYINSDLCLWCWLAAMHYL